MLYYSKKDFQPSVGYSSLQSHYDLFLNTKFRVLVEPACGSALSAVYENIIGQYDLPGGDIGK